MKIMKLKMNRNIYIREISDGDNDGDADADDDNDEAAMTTPSIRIFSNFELR